MRNSRARPSALNCAISGGARMARSPSAAVRQAGSVRRSPDQALAAQAGHQLDAAVRAHARQHGRHMLLDGAFRQAERLGDALVGQTIQQQRQDVALALGQAQVGRRHQHIELGGFHGHGVGPEVLKPGAPVQQLGDGAMKHLGRLVLQHEAVRAGLHGGGPHAGPIVAAHHQHARAVKGDEQVRDHRLRRVVAKPEGDQHDGRHAAFGQDRARLLGIAGVHGVTQPGVRAQKPRHAARDQGMIVDDQTVRQG